MKRTPEIEITVLKEIGGLDLKGLEERLIRLLADHGDRGRVSCVLTDDAHLQQLNRDFRGNDRPTDVLSFEMTDGVHPVSPLLGEVFISLDRALEQARESRRKPAEEIAHLAVHGVLHLLGYEHDTRSGSESMRAAEARYLTFEGPII